METFSIKDEIGILGFDASKVDWGVLEPNRFMIWKVIHNYLIDELVTEKVLKYSDFYNMFKEISIYIEEENSSITKRVLSNPENDISNNLTPDDVIRIIKKEDLNNDYILRNAIREFIKIRYWDSYNSMEEYKPVIAELFKNVEKILNEEGYFYNKEKIADKRFTRKITEEPLYTDEDKIYVEDNFWIDDDIGQFIFLSLVLTEIDPKSELFDDFSEEWLYYSDAYIKIINENKYNLNDGYIDPENLVELILGKFRNSSHYIYFQESINRLNNADLNEDGKKDIIIKLQNVFIIWYQINTPLVDPLVLRYRNTYDDILSKGIIDLRKLYGISVTGDNNEEIFKLMLKKAILSFTRPIDPEVKRFKDQTDYSFFLINEFRTKNLQRNLKSKNNNHKTTLVNVPGGAIILNGNIIFTSTDESYVSLEYIYYTIRKSLEVLLNSKENTELQALAETILDDLNNLNTFQKDQFEQLWVWYSYTEKMKKYLEERSILTY